MKFFVERLSTGGQSWGAVVHLGAGGCTELAAYRKMRPAQLLLVEAHPRLADELARKIHSGRGEQLVQAAVTAHAGPASLQVLNNCSESSVLAPRELLRYLPNLRLAETIEVPSVGLQALLEDLPLDSASANLLVVELGGLELDVLGATDELYLHKFSHLLVRGADAVLYDGGAAGSALKDGLHKAGFVLRDSQPEHLPPFMNWLFVRDEQVVQERRYIRELELAHRTHEAQLQALRAEHQEALEGVVQQLVDNLNGALRQNMQQDEVLQELQHRFDQLEQESECKLQELVRSMNDVVREKMALEEQLKDSMQELAALAQAKEQLAAAHESQEAALQETRQQLAQVEQDRATQADLERQRQVYVTQLQLARDSQERQLSELQEQLAAREEAASAAATERDDLRAAAALQGRMAADTQLQADKLAAQNVAVKEVSRDLVQQLAAAQAAQAAAGQERDAARQRIAELEYLLGDQSESQQLLDVEVLRAQAQIALLRDVLLREPGL